MIWLWVETGDAARVAALATGVFWLVIPSLAVPDPAGARPRGVGFPPSMAISVAATVVCYCSMIAVLPRIDVRLDQDPWR